MLESAGKISHVQTMVKVNEEYQKYQFFQKVMVSLISIRSNFFRMWRCIVEAIGEEGKDDKDTRSILG